MKEKCIVCNEKIRLGRVPPYCSMKCEKSVEGYSEGYMRELDRASLKDKVAGTTAWKPLPIEPVSKIVSASPIMVFSDIHAPLHSEEWIYCGLEVARKFEAKTLIVSGDFIDANSISRHIGGYYRRKSELNDDLAAGEALLKIFAAEFEKVYFLSGNHCMERLVKVFRGEVQVQKLWQMFGSHSNVVVSARSYVEVNKEVIIGHPRQYSRIRGNVPQKVAQLWQKHVALGHAHHSAKTITTDGRWQAIDLPCLAQLDEFEYTGFEISDMPKPLNGFAMVTGELITVFDRFTDWSLLGFKL
jgi:hypothetical protein